MLIAAIRLFSQGVDFGVDIVCIGKALKYKAELNQATNNVHGVIITRLHLRIYLQSHISLIHETKIN